VFLSVHSIEAEVYDPLHMPDLQQHHKPTTPDPMNESNASQKPAWDTPELDSVHDNAHKHDKVRAMFSAIARSYDLNNRVHSLWQDEMWRRKAVKLARVQPGERVLDVACGTGDLTQAFAKRSRASEVVGVDFTPAMLDIAAQKQSKLHDAVRTRIEYQQGDAQNLDFADNSFDVLSIAFGIRNVQDPQKAFAEFARVLRPGGRIVVLEFGVPTLAPMRWFNSFYCATIMPRTATWISGDRSGAYRYLPKSVATFYSREEMESELTQAGFSDLRTVSMSLGICNCTVGSR
jgi:demethylmenaquinone methyltransferase/2-methoxy-6-polyprenyl-1,4-benzoquinol methylase